jgi:hypothetical protein
MYLNLCCKYVTILQNIGCFTTLFILKDLKMKWNSLQSKCATHVRTSMCFVCLCVLGGCGGEGGIITGTMFGT